LPDTVKLRFSETAMFEFTIFTYAGGALIALFVGFLTGIFGVGGGFLMAPALIVLLGVPGHIAVGTDLVTVFVNSSFGMFKRRGNGTVDTKLGFSMAGGSIIGVAIGLAIMKLLKDMPGLVVFGKEQVAVQYILLWLFLLLLVGIAWFVAFDLRRNSGKKIDKRVGVFSKIKLPPYVHFSSLEQPQIPLVPVVALGCGAGILTGLMGVGGGIVMLPALIYLIGQRTAKAVGTSLLVVWVSSMVGGAGHIIQGNINLTLLAGMLAGGIIGTNLGTYVGLKLAGAKIRLYFIYVVILAVIMVAFKLYRLTFG